MQAARSLYDLGLASYDHGHAKDAVEHLHQAAEVVRRASAVDIDFSASVILALGNAYFAIVRQRSTANVAPHCIDRETSKMRPETTFCASSYSKKHTTNTIRVLSARLQVCLVAVNTLLFSRLL